MRETGEPPSDARLLPSGHVTLLPSTPSSSQLEQLELLVAGARREMSGHRPGTASIGRAQKSLRIDGQYGDNGHLGLLVSYGYTGLLNFYDQNLAADRGMAKFFTLMLQTGTPAAL